MTRPILAALECTHQDDLEAQYQALVEKGYSQREIAMALARFSEARCLVKARELDAIMKRCVAALALAATLTACALPPQVMATAVLPPADMPSGLGATVRHQYGCEATVETLALLDGPMWHNWIQSNCDQPHHTPMAYSMRPAALSDYIEQHDGGFTLVGSEPNIEVTHIDPAEAAEFSRGWVAQTDALWACCGTLHTDNQPQLYDWLDDYLAADGAVGDVWHLHIYFTSFPREWDATVDQFRDWMQRNDVVRPLIISETTQNSSHFHEALLRHIHEVVRRDDAILAAFWYPGDEDAYHFAPRSELTRDGKRTPLGDVFVQLQQAAGQGDEPDTLRMWLPMVRR